MEAERSLKYEYGVGDIVVWACLSKRPYASWIGSSMHEGLQTPQLLAVSARRDLKRVRVASGRADLAFEKLLRVRSTGCLLLLLSAHCSFQLALGKSLLGECFVFVLCCTLRLKRRGNMLQ